MVRHHRDCRERPTSSILIVEDDVLLRSLVAEYLEDCDFSILQAATAEEAIGLLRANERIGVVFSDVQMPGDLDGIDLARWVSRERPEVKVLLVSGKIAREQVGDWAFLAKPYKLGQVEIQLRDFLHMS